MGSFLFRKTQYQTWRPFETTRKVNVALLAHLYQQTSFALLASLFCVLLVYIGLWWSAYEPLALLNAWGAFALAVIIGRWVLGRYYKQAKIPAKKIKFWRRWYVMGAACGGLSWGVLGLVLLPYAAPIQQTLMILTLAGVTAGSIPLLSAVPMAALSFLCLSIPAYIYSVILYESQLNMLFGVSLTLYFVYTITLVINTSRLIKQSMVLKYENDKLLLNISEAKNQLEITNEKLQIAATHDPLTKISNRALFHINLQKAMDQANRSSKPFALFYFDLDRFKQANDAFGHYAGDKILLEVTGRLVGLLGNKSTISRLGGDEFSLIVEDLENVQHIDELAKHICQVISLPIQINENLTVSVGVSMGISIYPKDAYDAESLLRTADKAMYVAKQRGGCHHRFHSGEAVDSF